MSADSVKTMYARVDGMYCVHCEQTVSHALRALDGVEQVSFQQNVACIRGASLPAADVIADAIRKAGYETDERHIGTSRRKAAGMIRWYEAIGIAAAILLLAFALNRIFGYNIFNAIPTVDTSAIRMPAISALFASGTCTRNSICIRVMPMPFAASMILGSTPSSPARKFRRSRY